MIFVAGDGPLQEETRMRSCASSEASPGWRNASWKRVENARGDQEPVAGLDGAAGEGEAER